MLIYIHLQSEVLHLSRINLRFSIDTYVEDHGYTDCELWGHDGNLYASFDVVCCPTWDDVIKQVKNKTIAYKYHYKSMQLINMKLLLL